MRNPEEPGGERCRLPAELPDRLEHLQEGLRRQVLGIVLVPDADVQIAVDPVEMDQVQLLERVAVACLRSLDERAHAFGLTLLLLSAGVAHSDCRARREAARNVGTAVPSP